MRDVVKWTARRGLRALPKLEICGLACLWLAMVVQVPCRADLAAPDNILYGLVVLNGQPVTATQTEVAIEARRGDGLIVARYQMGAAASAGNFYVLAIKVEEVAPPRNPVAVVTNQTLRIVVVRNGHEEAEAAFKVVERGQVQRMDFGSVPLTGFEAWAAEKGLGAGSGELDADGDGFSNLQEYVAGTDPKDPKSHFALVVARTVGGVEVSFSALGASGTGYENQQRYYALESTAFFQTNSWTGVPGFTNIVGAGQRVIWTCPATNGGPAFYRGRVELRGP